MPYALHCPPPPPPIRTPFLSLPLTHLSPFPLDLHSHYTPHFNYLPDRPLDFVTSGAAAGGGSSTSSHAAAEKVDMRTMVSSIMQFLLQHKYNGKTPINERALMTGSVALVRDVFTFLFQCVDPRIEFSRDKFASEVFALFKRFGYQPQKLKSALQTAGSLNWSTVVGAMAWLVESLKHTMYVSSQRDADFEVTEFNDKFVTRLALNTYPQWMASADDESAGEAKGQSSAIAKEMEAANEVLKGELERKRARLEGLKSDIEALRSTQSKLPELDKQKEECRWKIKELKEAVAEATAREELVRGKLMDRRSRLKDVHEKNEDLKKKRQVLDKRVSEQEMTPREVQHLATRRAAYEATLCALVKERTSSEAKVKDKEREVSSTISDTLKLNHDVRKAAVDLLMVPSTAQNANGVDYRIEINVNATDYSDIVNVDLDKLRDALVQLSSKLNSEYRSVLAEKQTKLTTMDQLENDKAALELKVEREKAKLKKMEEGYELDKQRYKAESEAVTERVAGVERAIEELRKKKEMNASESSAKVEKLQQQLEELKQQQAQERNAMNDRLSELADRLANHFTKINDICQVTVQRAEEVVRIIEEQ